MEQDILFYTFHSFKHLELLRSQDVDLFVIKKLDEEFPRLCEKIRINNYSHIIGFGNSRRNTSEMIAINKFRRGVINKGGRDSYQLEPIIAEGIKFTSSFTKSYCNRAMYKISEFLDEENIAAKHSFIHIKKSGKEIIRLYLSQNFPSS